jgi:hypothetical protein
MTKFIYDSLVAGATEIVAFQGVATLAASAASPLDLAAAIAYVDSWAHELTTWGTSEDYSSFSPEDLPSNIVGIEVAKRAIAAGGAFNGAVDAAVAAVMAELGARPMADTTAAFAKIKDNWWTTQAAIPPMALLRRNFDGTPWPAGMAFDDFAATPAWLRPARFWPMFALFSYRVTDSVAGQSGVTLATMPMAANRIKTAFVAANPGKDAP